MISTRRCCPKFAVEQTVYYLTAGRKDYSSGKILAHKQCRDELQKRTIEYLIQPINEEQEQLWIYERFVCLEIPEQQIHPETPGSERDGLLDSGIKRSTRLQDREERHPLRSSSVERPISSSPTTLSDHPLSETDSFTTASAYSPVPQLEANTTPAVRSQKKKLIRKEFLLKFPDNLIRQMEEDEKFIKEDKKLCKLPAAPNVVVILESFLKNYVLNLVIRTPEKSKTCSKEVSLLERVNLCREYVDNIRIMFDFILDTSLLYSEEEEQRENLKTVSLEMPSPGEQDDTSKGPSDAAVDVKAEEEPVDDADSIPLARLVKRRRTDSVFSDSDLHLRKQLGSPRSQTDSQTSSDSFCRSAGSTRNPRLFLSSRPGDCKILDELNRWSLVPSSMYTEKPAAASLLYGGVHLLRFLAIMPQFLSDMELPEDRWLVVKSYTDTLVQYLSSQGNLLDTEYEEAVKEEPPTVNKS